ncbi:hypothetical protein [Aggregatilinea lenta]|uniref:hypothetical protein n=1 Tax=Aggregatilinea lenta TaxID=913108 RepID=UPI000E5C0ED0|nr:hypothetical protein [Aggregatilinea lenta]
MSVLVIVAVLMGTPVLSVFAQGDNPACAGLEAADCETLTGAAAAFETVKSFSIPSFSFSLTGTYGTDSIDVSASGSGEFMLPADATNPTEGLMVHVMLDSYSANVPGEEPQSGSVELIVVDGMVYANVDGEWYGEAMTEEDAQSLTDTFGGTMTGSFGLDSLGIDMTGVVSTTRGADTDVDGQTVQTFVTSVDVSAMLVSLLSSPAFGSLLGMGMGEDASALGMDQMTPEDMQMMAAIFAPMLAGTTIEVSQGIGADDSYIHSLALDIVLNLDLTMFDPEAGSISGEMHLATDISGHNETFTVEAPAEYSPMEELDMEGNPLAELGM